MTQYKKPLSPFHTRRPYAFHPSRPQNAQEVLDEQQKKVSDRRFKDDAKMTDFSDPDFGDSDAPPES